MNDYQADPETVLSRNLKTIRILVITVTRETKLFASTQSDETITEVAAMLGHQIDLLPKHLRIAVNLAIHAFNFEPVIFRGRTFSGLSQSARNEHLKRWDNSRFSAKRDFVRYIRSLVLFNYYDHPNVRSKI